MVISDKIQCDDGNLLNGDGCNDQCEIEADYWECLPNLQKRSICIDTRPLITLFERDLTTSLQYILSFNKPIVIPVVERLLEVDSATIQNSFEENEAIQNFFDEQFTLEIEGLNQN